MARVRSWLTDLRGELEEMAFVAPVLLLLTLGLINLAMVGVAGAVASDAAAYGARMGAVAQGNPAVVAFQAAHQVVSSVPIGDYLVQVRATSRRGGEVRVVVRYFVPNYFGRLSWLFGVNTPPVFAGSATASFRKEGW